MCTIITILSVESPNFILFGLPQFEIYANMPLKKRKLVANDDSKVPRKNAVTEGDAKLKTTKILSCIIELSTMLSEIIEEQRMDFHNQSKAKMKEFFTLIQDATM